MTKKELNNAPIAPRVFVLIPTDGYNAIVICRFNSRKTGVFKWDLLSNKVTVSQWLKSRIHESLSDISLDGKYFIYTANDKGYGYTAISKAPWIKAISFWWDGGFRGGGFFIDNKRYLLNNGKVGYHEFSDKSIIGVKSGKFAEKNQPFNAVYEAFFTDYSFHARLLKNGWVLKMKEHSIYIFTKSINSNTVLEKHVHGYSRIKSKGKGAFWESHRMIIDNVVEEKEDWEWCEYWHNTIYYSEKGCLYALTNIENNPKLIHDFNNEVFVCNRAPY